MGDGIIVPVVQDYRPARVRHRDGCHTTFEEYRPADRGSGSISSNPLWTADHQMGEHHPPLEMSTRSRNVSAPGSSLRAFLCMVAQSGYCRIGYSTLVRFGTGTSLRFVDTQPILGYRHLEAMANGFECSATYGTVLVLCFE